MANLVRSVLSLPYLLFWAYMRPKVRRNPLYSERLYAPALRATETPRTGGTYNFYLLSLIVFAIIAWCGGLHPFFLGVLAVSTLLAIGIDRAPWRQKVSFRDMPLQAWRYVRLVGLVLRTEVLVLIVATGLVYGLVKPFTRPLDAFGGHTFLVLYGVYLAIRMVAFVQYLGIVCFRWESYQKPPFAIRKANFRDRPTAVRHLAWSFLLGNVGLVVRCGYYDLSVHLYDRFFDWVGYPALAAPWGVLAAIIVIVLWFALADIRLGHPYYKAHRALHEDQSLYASIHRVHHYAVYPTILDSGTINPAEFILTESGSIWFAPLPDWSWFAFQIAMMTGHFDGHHTRGEEPSQIENHQFHVLHHRLFHCNFGLPDMDKKFNTLVVWPEREASQAIEPDRLAMPTGLNPPST